MRKPVADSPSGLLTWVDWLLAGEGMIRTGPDEPGVPAGIQWEGGARPPGDTWPQQIQGQLAQVIADHSVGGSYCDDRLFSTLAARESLKTTVARPQTLEVRISGAGGPSVIFKAPQVLPMYSQV